MGRGTLIALGAAVLVVGGIGYYLYRRNQSSDNPTGANIAGGYPVYAPGGPDPYNPQGPPLTAGGKIGQTFQDIGNAVQEGGKAFQEAKKTWDDVKGYFG